MKSTDQDIKLVKEESVDNPVPPVEDKRMKLSPSSILTYRNCPRQFFYRYVLRLPTKASIHLTKGTVVHSVFEDLFKKKAYYKKDLEAEGDKLFKKHWDSKKEELSTLDMVPEELETHRIDGLLMVESYIRKIRLDMELLLAVGKAKSESHAYMLVRPQFKEMFLEDKELLLKDVTKSIQNLARGG